MVLVPAPYLRQGLLSNATTNLGLSLFMLLAAGLLTRAFALPISLLVSAGLALGALSILLGTLSLRPVIPRAAIWAVIGFNVVWAADGLLAVAAGWLQPTRPGTVLVLAQAGVAAMYAGLQWIGLRRSQAQPG
jgi:hypothetical protein